MVTNWLAELDGRRVVVEVPAIERQPRRRLRLPRRRARAVQPGRGRGPRLEPRRDRADRRRRGRGRADQPTATNRCVRGIEAALREVRGEIPDGVGWRIEMRNEIPLARGLGLVRRGDRGRARGRQQPARRTARPRPTCSASRPRSRAIPDNAAAALLGGFTVSAATADGIEFAPVRRPARPPGRPVHPGAAPVDEGHAGRPAGPVPLADAVANIGRVAIGVAGLAARPVRPARGS